MPPSALDQPWNIPLSFTSPENIPPPHCIPPGRYVDFLDCTGTMYSMANYLNLFIPNFVDMKTKKFERWAGWVVFFWAGLDILLGWAG